MNHPHMTLGAPCPDFRTWDFRTATTPGAPSSRRLFVAKVGIALRATFHRCLPHPKLTDASSPQGPTARSIPAQGNALGNARERIRGLKARPIPASGARA
jgi:hypothetical protein